MQAGGRWVPTTSTDQLAATLVSLLGVPSERLAGEFPNLRQFTQKTLGFLGG